MGSALGTFFHLYRALARSIVSLSHRRNYADCALISVRWSWHMRRFVVYLICKGCLEVEYYELPSTLLLVNILYFDV